MSRIEFLGVQNQFISEKLNSRYIRCVYEMEGNSLLQSKTNILIQKSMYEIFIPV